MELLFKRPLVLFAISLIAGITVASVSGSFFLAAAALLLLAVCMHMLHGRIGGKLFIYIGILVFYSTGAFEFLCLDRANTGRFDGYGGEQVTVRGFVASEPDVKEMRASYIINVSEIRGKGDFEKKKGKILLTTILNENNSFIDFGRELEFAGQLNLPRGVRNPGGFDYRRYLSQKGVSAVVFAMNGNIVLRDGRRASVLADTGRMLRLRIVKVIEGSLPRQQAGLLNGILIGYREGLTEEVKNAFSDAGLTHIMAVSGGKCSFSGATFDIYF